MTMTTTLTTTYDICLCIRYGNSAGAQTVLTSFCYGLDDERLCKGRDYFVEKRGNKRFGWWIFTAANEETFKRLMKARWGLGGSALEMLQCHDVKEFDGMYPIK